MTPGRMRYRIAVRRRIQKPDGMGGFSSKWEDVGQLWADVRSPRIREQLAAGTPVTELTGEIVTRRGGIEIRRGDQVVEGRHRYEVIDVKPYELETQCALVREVES